MDPLTMYILSKEEQLLLPFLCRQRRNEQRDHTARIDIDSMDDEECIFQFRFGKDELRRLQLALQIPEKVVCSNLTVGSGLECLCILLRRLAYPNRHRDLEPLFGRSKSELSLLFNATLEHVHEKFGHLLTTLNQEILSRDKLAEYSAAVHRKGAPLTNCWGFIDGTARPICRPTRNQRVAFSGHKRYHALKFQSVMLPNGIIANMFGPLEGCRHDAGLLRESALLEQLDTGRFFDGEQVPYSLYGDPAYPLNPYLLCPYRGVGLTDEQAAFNKAMSSVRESVEWGFCKILQQFAFLDFRKNLKVLLQPVGKYYLVGTILTNCHTCLYGSQTTEFFDLQPPALEEYLR